ncbi:MAG: DNA repair protein RadA, partial [Rhizobiaceae bacterium]
MAKARTTFICQSCGASASRWSGRCDDCGEWNTLVEETASGGVAGGPAKASAGRRGRV